MSKTASISNIVYDDLDNRVYFTLSNIDLSIVNGLRRTILS